MSVIHASCFIDPFAIFQEIMLSHYFHVIMSCYYVRKTLLKGEKGVALTINFSPHYVILKHFPELNYGACSHPASQVWK